jgi:hypothetical protein
MKKEIVYYYTECDCADIRCIVDADARIFNLKYASAEIDDGERYDYVEGEWYKTPQICVDYFCYNSDDKKIERTQCTSMTIGYHIPMPELLALQKELCEKYGFKPNRDDFNC